jgi:predicted ATPase/DNA-binding winged helix-turn-helix (wHTH) protein
VSDASGPSADDTFVFGPFRLLPARQLLLEGEKTLRVGSRALEILKVLVEHAGTLVSKEDLVARVWPGTFVEEGNLRVHMAALRRVLGDGQSGNRYIATIPGRGYRFVAPVSILAGPQPPEPPRGAAEISHNLPVSLTRIVGRSDIVAALAEQLPTRRFITLAGPGGIGKTTVALAVADELSQNYRDGVWFVDFASIVDAALVPSALASVLGVAIRSDNPVPGLLAYVKDKQMLLVLDSCERVIDAAAALAEQVFQRAPGVHILTTSRESLRAEGERVQRLLPLEVPPASTKITADEAMSFSAIQLFVERATANTDGFRLTDADSPIVAEICRRLDGIALAIELAAGRIDVLGLQGLAAHLDDRFRLLTRGRRTALPRHQTLSATLDWSYELLSPLERTVLRRLAVFAGAFTLPAASTVASSGDVTTSDVADCVANLVAKSLVTADFSGTTVTYRLFETMRAYALEKLTASGERSGLGRRHAEYFREVFAHAELEWEKQSPSEWLATYSRFIDNVRAALEWAFSKEGDPDLGVSLTVVAVPLWLQLSLMEECRNHVERAVATARLQRAREAGREVRRDMQLSAALGSVLVYTNMGPVARAAWTEALAIAEKINDADYKLRSLWGLWVDSLNNGEFQEAIALARRFYDTAAGLVDAPDVLLGDRMIGIALHFLGSQLDARRHIDRMLGSYVTPIHAAHIVRFQFDQRVTARAFQARCLWLLGFPDQALHIIESTVGEARAIGHVLTLCNVLGQGACQVALWSGDLSAAERYLDLLLEQSASHTIGLWHAWGLCFRGLVLIRRGDDGDGLHALRSVLAEVPEIRSLPRYLGLLGELAIAMGRAGHVAQALETIEGAIGRSENRQERWCLPELLRIKGELLLQEKAPNAASTAAACFCRGLDLAIEQSALSWQLRAATSLARLQRDQRNIADARNLLRPVYGQFTEGFASHDLTEARHLLDFLA